MFIGNGDGLISFGKGKGEDYESAFDNAYKSLRNNLVCLRIENAFTSAQSMEAHHNDFAIKIIPQPVANFWGNPLIWKMLTLTGFYHCRFICKSRKRDPYSMMYAYFAAVTQNIPPS